MTASTPRARRLPVAILGATGAVGQTFIRCLRNHPWFEVTELAASERSAGKRYADATRWLEGELPGELADRTVLPCDPAEISAPIVFSALDAAAAGDLEPAFARSGALVLSNAKNFRMEPDVPLVIPEVNANHLSLLEQQRRSRGWSGGIVTNANCAATVATVALAPLHEAFGVRQVFVVTMQAVSGAGYPGVPSLDILGNVIPYIGEEEPKIEREIPKMLGCSTGARKFIPTTWIVWSRRALPAKLRCSRSRLRRATCGMMGNIVGCARFRGRGLARTGISSASSESGATLRSRRRRSSNSAGR